MGARSADDAGSSLVLAFSVEEAARVLSVVPDELAARVVLVTDDLLDAVPPGLDSADEVVTIPGLADAAGALVGEHLAEHAARSRLVVLDSSQASRDVAGWLVAVLDAPVVWAVDALRAVEGGVVECDRIVLGGGYRLVHAVDDGRPAIVLVRPGGPAAARTPRATSFATWKVEREASAPAWTRRRDEDAPRGQSFNGARLVVTVGRGIGGPEHLPLFRTLAEQLGGVLGASRVVVDNGWLPFAHQVGQTGATVSPDVYLAFGVSGAIQHLAGMRGSKCVVAVNVDADAPLCRMADLVVQSDAVEFAERLLASLGDGGKL